MVNVFSRAITAATAGAIALGTVGLQPAAADGLPAYPPPPAYDYGNPPPPAGYDYGYPAPGGYTNNGDAAAAALVFGTMAAIIAGVQHRRHSPYGPVYGAPVYGAPVFGGRAYGGPDYARFGRHWRHFHHR